MAVSTGARGRSQFAPHPTASLLEHPLGLHRAEALQPAAQDGGQGCLRSIPVFAHAIGAVILSLLRNRCTLLTATR